MSWFIILLVFMTNGTIDTRKMEVGSLEECQAVKADYEDQLATGQIVMREDINHVKFACIQE